jgi:predicted DNA-binding protein
MQRPSFSKDYVVDQLDKLAPRMPVPVSLIIIGGLGLINFGLKIATKDIDIVVQSRKELDALVDNLGTLKYRTLGLSIVSKPYKKMEASQILENREGFRWDIFLNQVCGALVLSAGMKSRTTHFYKKELLEARIASKEDLFLFKGITDRVADLDDMRLLAESGLNWRVIEQECKNQSISSGRLWENALLGNLIDIRERYNIRSPIERTLEEVVKERLSEDALKTSIEKGNATVTTISKCTGLTAHLVRKYAKKMEEKGTLQVDRSSYPHKFILISVGSVHRRTPPS